MNLLLDLQKYNIYENIELTEYIVNLENKYNVIDGQYKFNYLVNFSNNLLAPYHQWFRYREGFAGKLVEDLLEISNASKNEMIIDPFAGSGTVPVVANMNGYHGLGIDINPVSAYVTKVKLQAYTEDDLIEAENLLSKLEEYNNESVKKIENDVKKFFYEHNYHELIIIRDFISKLSDSLVKDLYNLSFICIIEICSNRRRDGNGLKTVYSKVKNIKAVFRIKLMEIITDIRKRQPAYNSLGFSYSDSASQLVNICNSIDDAHGIKPGAIIFSPPYANSFNYFESYKMELIMGEFVRSIKDLKVLKSKAVRSFIGVSKQKSYNQYVDILSNEIEESIPIKEKQTGRRDNRTRKVPNMIRGYFYDMDLVISQCSQVLDVGKKCFIVIDQSAYLGKIVPSDLIFANAAEKYGFEVTSITVCRNARTSAQQLKKFPYLKDLLRESIVELTKAK